APGCAFARQTDLEPLSPERSGVAGATVWQFAQSPQRREITARCRATYAADGNCYAPGLAAQGMYVDLDVAASSDPSHGR
ncbi:MAG: glycoside hydrolase domain-containing protein, partial [Candidatus Acidiferrales bacterium]